MRVTFGCGVDKGCIPEDSFWIKQTLVLSFLLKTDKHGRQNEKRKELHNVFEQFGLKIIAVVNLHVANFLDVTFDLAVGQRRPY